MSTLNQRPASRSLFWGYVIAFVAIYLAFYPATYAIEDEFNILALSVSLSRGTVFLDLAGLDLDADLLWNGHRISKFSPFHAALLVPAVLTDWRLGFAVTAGFVIVGALVFRSMLRREGLSPEWVALYFLCPGVWFYSRTVMAAVPAAVMVLLGASLLVRSDKSRPAAAGAALGVAGLFHPWMIPVAGALSLGWWADDPRGRLRSLMVIVASAFPAAAILLFYNFYTTGSPFKNAYTVMGTHYGFRGENLAGFLPLYAGSLLFMPLAGWAALSRRWSGGLAIPSAVGTVVVMSSLYYFRDGLGHGVAGLLPGQRFLIPASMLACLPAARMLAHRFGADGIRAGGWFSAAQPLFTARVSTAALVCFITGFTAVSVWHGMYLDAHREVQAGIKASIPDGSRVLVGDRAFKEFAPVLGTWQLSQLRDREPTELERQSAYAVWIGPPGALPPGWFSDPAPRRVSARSWVWNRDVWIGTPGKATAHR